MSLRSRRAILVLGVAVGSAIWARGGDPAPLPGPPPRFRVDWANPDAREFRALPGIGAITADRLVKAVRAGDPIAGMPGLSAEARAGLAEQGGPFAVHAARRTEGRLDPNVATAEELEALPGIGPVLARRVIAVRGEKPFADLEDFVGRVAGVGPKLRDRLRPLLDFGAPEPELAEVADPR